MVEAFAKSLPDIEQNLLKKFKKVVDTAINHPEDFDEVFRDFEDACTDTGHASTDAAMKSIKEHLIRARGMSKAEAEWLEQKWKDVKDLDDKVRPKIVKAGKPMWLKVLGKIAFGGVVLVGLNMSINTPTRNDIQMRNQLDQIRQLTETPKLLISEDQFSIMAGGLMVQDAPFSSVQMPAAVAAVADKPVEVELATPSGTRTFTSTVGRVYQNVPEAARPAIEHGYDQPAQQHKDITVTSPVGSGHFTFPSK